MNNPIFGMMNDPMGNQMNMMNNPSMNQMGMDQNMMNNQMNMMNQMNMNNQMNMMNQMPMNNQMNMMNQMPMNNQMMMPQMMNQMNMMNNQMMFNMMNQNMTQMANLANASQNMQMVNNQQQNMDFGNQSNPVDNNPQVEITFIKNDPNTYQKKIKIFCLYSDKVSDIITRYRTKAEDDNVNENFVFNAKNLNPELTVSESGLQNQSIIFVINKEGMKGGK